MVHCIDYLLLQMKPVYCVLGENIHEIKLLGTDI